MVKSVGVFRAAVVLALLGWLGACGGLGSTPGEGSPSSRGCGGARAGPHPDDVILEDGHVGLADLDCDGSVDTVRVEWIYKQGIPYAQTSVVGRELSGRSSGQTDQLPQLVSFADLNADGLRDIVVMYLDDSAVIGEVELVRRDGLRFPVADPALDWEHMDYVWPGDLSGSRDTASPRSLRVWNVRRMAVGC